MGKRSTRPALYELMRNRAGLRMADPDGSADDAPPASDSVGSLLTPGRALRLPVGYLLLALAGTIVVVVVAFIIGYGRASDQADSEHAEDLASQIEADRVGRMVNDPMATNGSPSGLSMPGTPTSGRGPAPMSAARGDIESEPRENGLNYFVLIHTTRLNALEFGEFCRSQGLDAYVVHADNASLPRESSLRQVIVLPGYAAGERSSPTIKALESRIKETMRRWAAHANVREDLSFYPDKFTGDT